MPVDTNEDEEQKTQNLKTLGFDENSTPSEEDIKKAYKKLSLKLHPDKNQGKSQQDLDAQKEQFTKVKEACDHLITPFQESALEQAKKQEAEVKRQRDEE